MTKLLANMTDEEITTDERLNMGVLLDRFAGGILAGYEGTESEYRDSLMPLADAKVIQDWIDNEIPRMVETARNDGATWQEIADVLGMTRQAAWQRFS